MDDKDNSSLFLLNSEVWCSPTDIYKANNTW